MLKSYKILKGGVLILRVKNLFGEIAVLCAAVLWGCIGFFTRNLTANGFTPVQLVAVRSLLTCAVLLVIMLIKDPKLLKVRPRDLWMFFGTGICSFMFFNICYMTSITENSLSVACILMYTSPIWVTTLSWPLFKEKLNCKTVISLVICLAGCVGVCASGSLVLTKRGLLFGLLSGFGYALYSLFGKVAAKRYSSLTVVFYTFLFSFVAILPFCDIKGITAIAFIPENALLLIGISALNTVLPYILYTYGLSKINAGKASIISIIEPAASAVTGRVFFSEKIGVIGFLGMAAVLAGLVFLEYSKKDPAAKTA